MAQIIGTGKQRSGKNSAAIISSTTLAYSKWNVEGHTVDLNTMNFISAGLEEGISGPAGLRWSLGGAWDAGTNPDDNPPGIVPRDDLPNVRLIVNVADTSQYFMTYARVRSTTVGTDVNGLVTFDASGFSQGAFLIPTGSV